MHWGAENGTDPMVSLKATFEKKPSELKYLSKKRKIKQKSDSYSKRRVT